MYLYGKYFVKRKNNPDPDIIKLSLTTKNIKMDFKCVCFDFHSKDIRCHWFGYRFNCWSFVDIKFCTSNKSILITPAEMQMFYLNFRKTNYIAEEIIIYFTNKGWIKFLKQNISKMKK